VLIAMSVMLVEEGSPIACSMQDQRALEFMLLGVTPEEDEPDASIVYRICS